MRFIPVLLLGFAIWLLSAPAHAACSNPTAEAGLMIFNADHKVVQWCDGDTWYSVGGGGSDTLSALNCTDGQIPSWDNGSSAWVCADVSGSGGGSSSSGVAIIDTIEAEGTPITPVTITKTDNKWPDYFICNDGTAKYAMTLTFYDPPINQVTYSANNNSQQIFYNFNLNGAYKDRGDVDANCGASAGNIESICNEDRCAFYGSGGGADNLGNHLAIQNLRLHSVSGAAQPLSYGGGGGGGGGDTTPDAFNFTDQSDVATSTQITSDSVTISGLGSIAVASVSGDGSPEIRIGGGSWVTSGLIGNGQGIEVRLTSSSSGAATHTATIDLREGGALQLKALHADRKNLLAAAYTTGRVAGETLEWEEKIAAA